MKTPAQKKEDNIRVYFARKTNQLPAQVQFTCDCISCGFGWSSDDNLPIAYCPNGETADCMDWKGITYTEKHTGAIFPHRAIDLSGVGPKEKAYAEKVVRESRRGAESY